MKKTLSWGIGLILFASFYWFGCNNATNPVGSNPNSIGKVSMSAAYTPKSVQGMQKSSSVSAVDSIKLTRVRVVLRNIRLKAEDDDHEVEMETEDHGDNKSGEDSAKAKLAPFVLELNLNGSTQQISITNVPFGTYDEFKFQIHRINQNEISGLPPAEQAKFADFLSGERYSIIIEGNVYKNGQVTPFTFRSKIDAEFELKLSPKFVVNQTQITFNLTLEVSSAGWFVDANGALVDPSDPNNASLINSNLKSFLHAFKDNDRDGKEDND